MVRRAGLLSFFLIVFFSAGAFADLIAYFPFNEGQGTATADVTGNGNDGTLSSGVEWATGIKGSGVQFDTAGERIVTSSLNPTAKNNAMTLAAWIQWTGQGGSISQQGIVGKRQGWDPGTEIKWFWQTNPAGDLLFRCDTAQGGTGLWWGNGRLVPYADEWTHVAVTWDSGTTVQYVNGEETDRGTVTLGGAAADATIVSIGCVSATNNETFIGTIDEVRIYDTALPPAGIEVAMTGDTASASAPQPAAEATDVARDAILSWAAGEYAAGHDVYLGTDFDTVDQAGRTDDRGVLASSGQSATSYQVDAPLEFGQTYYWRVDEVNAPPGSEVHKGAVWSFTVEPYAYPITGVTATASSAQAGMGPEKTVDGSGMTGDLHGTEPSSMWLSAGTPPNWIQYDLGRAYKMYEMQVWNSNQLIEGFLGFGAKKVRVETSLDGTTWTPVVDVPEFAQAPGAPDYAANTTVNLNVQARYVRLTIDSTWGGVAPQTGLSEVQFSYIPVVARAPQPADNAGGVSLNPTLDWRPGREATSHEVLFGSDPAAVAAGTAPAQTVSEHSFDSGMLDFGTFYYWKVDEIGATTYPGSVWSFSTQTYQAVDDFESYTDQAGEEIFSAWIDGFTNGLSGSTVGYFTASDGTFGETTIVHGGRQSMPLQYDNAAAPFFSEAERTFASAQDWTTSGAENLVVFFRGQAPGFVETASGSILMNAIGTDIWGNSDQFRYAYKSLSGDGTMVARVDSVVNSNVWAKAGVMIRQSVDAASVHAFMPITPGGSSAGNGASFQQRLNTGGVSTNSDNTGTVVAAPYWVKIERKGNNFSGYISPDGQTWTQLGTAQTIPMANPVLIGLALCSHDAAIPTSAEFSNVSTTGNVTGNWQVAEIGATQPEGNSVEGLYLVVEDSSGTSKVVQHPDAAATTYMTWQQWVVPLSELTAAGVKMNAVKSLTIGVGNKAAPKAGGTGTVYIDDISFGRPLQWIAQPGEILLEAESATSITAPMKTYDDSLASGGKYIGTDEGSGDNNNDPPTTGVATYQFTVPGGDYKILLRVSIANGSNSVWVRIPDATSYTPGTHSSGWIRFNDIEDGAAWHWDEVHSSDHNNEVVQVALSAGEHTLEIARREDGARVDAIVIQPVN